MNKREVFIEVLFVLLRRGTPVEMAIRQAGIVVETWEKL
jgi:hypothetical protein